MLGTASAHYIPMVGIPTLKASSILAAASALEGVEEHVYKVVWTCPLSEHTSAARRNIHNASHALHTNSVVLGTFQIYCTRIVALVDDAII